MGQEKFEAAAESRLALGQMMAAWSGAALGNLNARAIASLKGNLASIEADIAVLIGEMERRFERPIALSMR